MRGKIICVFLLLTPFVCIAKPLAMVSGYKLENSNEYLTTAMDALSNADATGIYYTNLNWSYYPITEQLERNEAILEKARDYGVKMHMQMRVYDNGLNLTARSLPKAGRKLDNIVARHIRQFSAYQSDCVVTLFEEASPYHKPQGGGDFWLGDNRHYDGTMQRPSRRWNSVFVYRFNRVFDRISVTPASL